MCVYFQLHTHPFNLKSQFTIKTFQGKNSQSATHTHHPLVWYNQHTRWKCKENSLQKTQSELVLTRTCSSNDPNCLPTLDVQVQPVENKGSIISVSHLIVSECYLPMARPVAGTGPHLEGVSAFRNTGLKSRITNGRLIVICFSIHLTHSFMYSFTQF